MHGIRNMIVMCAAVLAGNGMASGQCEEAKLFASGGEDTRGYGGRVTICGDTAAVGGIGADLEIPGAVYMYERSGGAWGGEVKLQPADSTGGDNFGVSVAMSGDTMLIGAVGDTTNGTYAGAAYVFVRDRGGWVEQAKLLPSDGEILDFFGVAGGISEGQACIGALGDDDFGDFSGAVYVFARDGSEWTEQAKLYASDAGEDHMFGYSLALDGDVLLIGSPWHDQHGTGAGAAYVFRFDGSAWTEEARLFASDPATNDHFGYGVALSGDVAVIGAYGDDQLGSNAGAASVFQFDGQQWTLQAKLMASDGQQADLFGEAVAVDGDVAVIGARNGDGLVVDCGAAYVFQRQGGLWLETAKFVILDGEFFDLFGTDVSLDNGRALIGAINADGVIPDAGAAYVFNLDATPGDVDCDGDVDAFDLALLLAAWGPCAYCPEDVNGDGVVNVLDLLIVLTNWT